MSCQGCKQCVKFKPLVMPACSDPADVYTIQVGTMPKPLTVYNLVFQNRNNGIRISSKATSDGTGLLVVNVTNAKSFFTYLSVFGVWVFEEGTSPLYNVDIDLGEGLAKCGELSFFKTHDDEGNPTDILNQKLELC